MPINFSTPTIAAASQVKAWTAATVVSADEPRRAPDGTIIISNSARTTRASYDATEIAAWTPAKVDTSTVDAAVATKLTKPTNSGTAGYYPAYQADGSTLWSTVPGSDPAMVKSLTERQVVFITPRAFAEIVLPDETIEYNLFATSAIQMEDRWARTVAGGLGTPSQGSAYTTTGTAVDFNVPGDGTATIKNPSANNNQFWGLLTPSFVNQDFIMDVAIPLPVASLATLAIQIRRVDANTTYRAVYAFDAVGNITSSIDRVAAGVAVTPAIVAAAVVSGLTYTSNKRVRIRTQAWGVNPTTIRTKIWDPTTVEPAWQRSGTDSTSALQVASGIGEHLRAGGGLTNFPFQWTLYPWVALGS